MDIIYDDVSVVSGGTCTYPNIATAKYESTSTIGQKISAYTTQQKEIKMYLPALVRNDDKWFAISTLGNVETFESEDVAVKYARSEVARNDTVEVVIAKAHKYIRIDKPVVVEDIK